MGQWTTEGDILMASAKSFTSTNDVLEAYSDLNTKITIRRLDRNTVLLEGDRSALEFLGNLLGAYARSEEHDVQLSPQGAGSARFTQQSDLGLYIHRLPCPDQNSGVHKRKTRSRLSRQP
jgi:hypothetical protein